MTPASTSKPRLPGPASEGGPNTALSKIPGFLARALNRTLPVGLAALVPVLFLSACTGERLEGTSRGWSPAAASSQVSVSRAVISEGRPFSESDTTLTVSSTSGISTGQTILLGTEQLLVDAVRGNDLSVIRGAHGTEAQPHADGAPVSVLTDDMITIYVATKQGNFTALEDDGFGPPVEKWAFRPLGEQ